MPGAIYMAPGMVYYKYISHSPEGATMSDTLTVPQVLTLAKLINAAHSNARLTILKEDGRLLEGVARRIGDDRGYLLPADTDVRDGFMHITTLAGWEHMEPMGTLVRQLQHGEVRIS